MVFSAPRTGSSVVFNIFRYLFEDEQALLIPHNEFRMDRSIFKTHNTYEVGELQKKSGKNLFIITIREPVQSCISIYRISPPEEDMKEACKKLIDLQVQYFNWISGLQNHGYPIVILRYEDFVRDPVQYLCGFIENHFHLSIAKSDREMIARGYSKENIYRNLQSLADFKEILPISGFHGDHVTLEPKEISRELLYWMRHFYEEAKPTFRKFGY